MPDHTHRCGIAGRQRTAILVIDFQEKFLPVIPDVEKIQANLVLLAKAAGILNIPLLITEQYPKGLGPTVSALAAELGSTQRIEKTSFSCFGENVFADNLERLGVDTLILGGVEAHVCVAQTALDALNKGYRVHILADAVGSRNPEHARIALERLRDAGAVISCTEMALFELLGKAGTPEFRQIQSLIKG